MEYAKYNDAWNISAGTNLTVVQNYNGIVFELYTDSAKKNGYRIDFRGHGYGNKIYLHKIINSAITVLNSLDFPAAN